MVKKEKFRQQTDYVGCSNNSIQILRIQREGKKEMNAEEFLVGNNLKKGVKLN